MNRLGEILTAASVAIISSVPAGQAADGKPFLDYKPGYKNYTIPEIVNLAQREGKLAELILELAHQGVYIAAPTADEVIEKLEAQVTPMQCADYVRDKGGLLKDVHTYDARAQQNGMIDRKCFPYEIVYVKNDTRAAVLAGSCSNVNGKGQMAIQLNPINSTSHQTKSPKPHTCATSLQNYPQNYRISYSATLGSIIALDSPSSNNFTDCSFPSKK